MSEQVPCNSNDWQIERPSPTIRLTIAEDGDTDCTYSNARVYMFAKPYDLMNHLYISGERDENNQPTVGTYIFGRDELLRTFISHAFPTVMEPFPSDYDLSAYSRYTAGVVELELQEFDGE